MTKLIPVETIASKILFLRNEKILLDRDLAELYGVETRVLNQAVSRNIRRFPPDFMFTLTRDEIMRISQIVTSSEIKYSKRVRAFTEQGVAMLSSVLNSQRAIEVNIAIMRAFVHLRKMILSHKELAKKLQEIEHHIKDHDEKIQAIFEAIQQLITLPGKSQKKIGFTAKEAQKSYGKKRTKN
jgi:predicted house-cleaning noncanonical NTP pyrophosphatase (MazG superfamily)